MDEPTNGVDPVSRRELWELIYELLDEGLSVLVSTPYMDEAARCHRVALLHHGTVVAEGAPNQLVQDMSSHVYELSCAQPSSLHEQVARLPFLLAASPSGHRLRVIVAPDHAALLREALAPLGAEVRRVTPSFEDLFLVSTREEAA